MRTNIVIDDTLMAEAMQITGITTKRAVVEEALKLLVRTSRQNTLLALQGSINWEGDLNEMRQGRFVHEEGVEYQISQGGSVLDDNYRHDEELEQGGAITGGEKQ
ncbi:MAG: type II toxin-antitoxin system VapB family antitoxin [Chloroflexota bacterium]